MQTHVYEEEYERRTTNSAHNFLRAKQIIPGGVQGNIKYFSPYPLTFQSASGAWMTDVDGKSYVDYLLSFGALILGHGHRVVKNALDEVWQTVGTSSFGVPHPLEVDMVECIRSLFPNIQQVRFTNSGLEATLLAIRAGMAYSGRPLLAKFAGHYHGGHEQVLVSIEPRGDQAPWRQVPESLRLPEYFVSHTVVLPFNDFPACERILRNQRDEIGVVILEPMQAGYIPADREFIHQLRSLTTDLGMVLVFDEVKTGFRVALGGAQEYYGVQADLTALGKVLGGGFPIGAVGGRRDIMELASPMRSSRPDEVVFHSGTFNGNPVSISAGLKTLAHLQEPGRFPALLETTMQLRNHIEQIADSYGFYAKTIGVGSIFNIHVNAPATDNDAGSVTQNAQLRRALDFFLMEHGVFSKPLNRYSLSLAHDATAINHTVQAFDRSFAKLKKWIRTHQLENRSDHVWQPHPLSSRTSPSYIRK